MIVRQDGGDAPSDRPGKCRSPSSRGSEQEKQLEHAIMILSERPANAGFKGMTVQEERALEILLEFGSARDSRRLMDVIIEILKAKSFGWHMPDAALEDLASRAIEKLVRWLPAHKEVVQNNPIGTTRKAAKTIAARMALREKRRYQQLVSVDFHDDKPPPGVAVSDRFGNAPFGVFKGLFLRACKLARFQPRDIRLLQLRLFQDLEYEDIAFCFNHTVSAAALRQRLCRLNEEFRDHFQRILQAALDIGLLHESDLARSPLKAD
jgi:hypothetical protein